MNHQDIVNRVEALGKERGAAYAAELARIDKERASLLELCGGLGHVFKYPDFLVMPAECRYRSCVCCGVREPASEKSQA